MIAAMDMGDYLREIEFAAGNIIPTLWAERVRVDELGDEVASLTATTKRNYEQAARIAMDDVPDDDGIATMIHWDTYFGPDKQRHEKASELSQAQDRLVAHEFSVAALAGSLMQHAKQGISLVHGGVSGAPDGRTIGSLPLKTIIWEARNQAIHWEEGNLRGPGTACFTALAAEQDTKFADFQTRSLAMDVVELLGWRSFESFADDMRSLG
jgi:hypothetical protein